MSVKLANPFGAPTASAPGDAQVTGAATTFANSGHQHAREAVLASGIALITHSTTPGASFADITDASVTLTTGAHRVRITLNTVAEMSALATNQFVEAVLVIDGTVVTSASAGQTAVGSPVVAADIAIYPLLIPAYLSAVLTAGSHTIKAQGRRTAGAGTIGDTTIEGYLIVEETGLSV